jgi:predicted RNase H-related nuclease YkuK (DUF458 family)
MNYIDELESRIKELEKRNIENAAKLGEAIGALKGILHNDIDQALKEKVEHILKGINAKTNIK